MNVQPPNQKYDFNSEYNKLTDEYKRDFIQKLPPYIDTTKSIDLNLIYSTLTPNYQFFFNNYFDHINEQNNKVKQQQQDAILKSKQNFMATIQSLSSNPEDLKERIYIMLNQMCEAPLIIDIVKQWYSEKFNIQNEDDIDFEKNKRGMS